MTWGVGEQSPLSPGEERTDGAELISAAASRSAEKSSALLSVPLLHILPTLKRVAHSCLYLSSTFSPPHARFLSLPLPLSYPLSTLAFFFRLLKKMSVALSPSLTHTHTHTHTLTMPNANNQFQVCRSSGAFVPCKFPLQIMLWCVFTSRCFSRLL